MTSTISVPSTSLDNLSEIQHLQKIDYLQIDTEGFDALVIDGAPSILSKTRYFMFEYYSKGFVNG